jgi:PASTA domain
MGNAVRLRCGRWRRLLGSIAAAVLVGFLVATVPALAPASQHDAVYTRVRVRVSATAVVDVRALARLNPAPRPVVTPTRLENEEVSEPQERAEPSAGLTVPMPFAAPSPMQNGVGARSPYVSESFLAQPDVPAVGTAKTESPPDTNGAVGRDKLMVPLNSNYVIQRKSDGKVLSRVSMDAFWRPVGALDPFDPRVLYDPYSDRWLVAAADAPLLQSSLILYGISDTADPQGTWHLYALRADGTGATWPDFPTLGFNQTTVTLGINMFAVGSLTYVRCRLIVLDYASLRAGGSGKPLDLSVPGGFALQPAATYSPTEKTLYLAEHLSSNSATYRLWSLNGGKLTLVGGAPRTNPLGPWSTPGPSNVLPQDRGRGIEAGDSRVGNAVFRNGHVWYAQTIALPPGGTGFGIHTAVQWVELDTTGAFVQGGRIEDRPANPWNGGHSYAFAALAVNARNDMLVGFSDFESDDYPDAAYAFRAGTDPPGTLRAPVILKDGEGPYDKTEGGARNRWGDYSGAQVDPSDDLSLWTVQEYARVPASLGQGDDYGRWGTWWGRVGGGPPLAPPRCVVPKVVGKPLAKAWQRVAAAHCRLGTVKRVKAAKPRRGRVVRQRPRAGKRLPSDARVNLTVGR